MATEYATALAHTPGRFQRALILSEGIKSLKNAILPFVGEIIHLQNSPLGFLTDKRDGGYPPQVVAECLVEATLRGVYPVGNEFNIISGRCYVTLAGFRRLVREAPGLTDLRLVPGVPKVATGGATVPFKATWKLNGVPDSLERDIPVRLNAGMGVDGAIGKATRKMLASVYGQITGSEHSDGEVDDAPPAETQQVNGPPTGRTSLKPPVPTMLDQPPANDEDAAVDEQTEPAKPSPAPQGEPDGPKSRPVANGKGKAKKPEPLDQSKGKVGQEKLGRLTQLAGSGVVSTDELDYILSGYGVGGMDELSEDQAEHLIARLSHQRQPGDDSEAEGE